MSADRCTTHHICDCKQAELEAAKGRIAELETSFVCPIEAICEEAADHLIVLQAELEAAQARVVDAETERDSAYKLLHDLTPGGSEYVDNPQRCYEWIENRLSEMIHRNVEYVKLRKAAETERDNYRSSAEKVAAVHVAIVTERDAARASESRLMAALESVQWLPDPERECYYCPSCAGRGEHAEQCQIKLALTAAESAATPADESHLWEALKSLLLVQGLPESDELRIAVTRDARAALGATPADAAVECTGESASWCPIHGDCICVRGWKDEINSDCPLHGTLSTHAEAPADADASATSDADDKAEYRDAAQGLLNHFRRYSMGHRCEIVTDMERIVAALDAAKAAPGVPYRIPGAQMRCCWGVDGDHYPYCPLAKAAPGGGQ